MTQLSVNRHSDNQFLKTIISKIQLTRKSNLQISSKQLNLLNLLLILRDSQLNRQQLLNEDFLSDSLFNINPELDRILGGVISWHTLRRSLSNCPILDNRKRMIILSIGLLHISLIVGRPGIRDPRQRCY